jgi:sugar phosphate isomerase/epimerase
MKIGYCNHPRRDLLEEVSWIGEHDFDFLDLFLEADRALPERIDHVALEKLLREYRLPVVAHTAWYLPLGSPMEELRQKAVEIVQSYFPLLEKLDCPSLTVHANWPSDLFTGEEGIAFQAESLLRLTNTARDFGIRILYEPLEGLKDTLKNLSRILKEVQDLLIHIDIGHAYIRGIQPAAYFKAFPGRIAHIHLHDNNGLADLHLPLGAGKINWKNTIHQIRNVYDGTVTLEVFSRDRDYVLLSKKKLRELWDDTAA